MAVLEEFPNATILRPGTVYGHEDKFLNFYACKLTDVYSSLSSCLFAPIGTWGLYLPLQPPLAAFQRYDRVAHNIIYLMDTFILGVQRMGIFLLPLDHTKASMK